MLSAPPAGAALNAMNGFEGGADGTNLAPAPATSGQPSNLTIAGNQAATFTTLGLPPPPPGSHGLVLNNTPASAGATSSHLVITPIFDASIQNDANAAAIEDVINRAIDDYQTRFADPITVSINFREMTTGLGSSTWVYYTLPYQTFINQLAADKTTVDDNTALAHLWTGSVNPVNGKTGMRVKTANIRALGIAGSFPTGLDGGVDGLVGLNTHITDVGSPDTSGRYNLKLTVEHEIDEVLGFGSSLEGTQPIGDTMPEDLYRYSPFSSRSFTRTGDSAYLSIDGVTQLVRLNQGNNAGGDYGDWWSNNGVGNPGPTPPTRVQDAFIYPGRHPALGVELNALDVIGYDPIGPTPSTLPAVPDLVAGSDTGLSSTDNRTSRNNAPGRTLQFTVANTVPGATVTLYADGTQIGTAVAATGTTTVTTSGAGALADGTHLFTAAQTETGKAASDAAGPLSVVIDATPPTILNPGNQSFEIEDTAGTRVTYGPPIVSDNLAPAPTVVVDHPSGSLFPPGDTPVTVTATDLAGNTTTASFTITLNDPAGISRDSGAAYSFTGLADAKLLAVSAGTVTLTGDLSATYPGVSLDVSAGAIVVFAVDQNFQDVSLAGGGNISVGQPPQATGSGAVVTAPSEPGSVAGPSQSSTPTPIPTPAPPPAASAPTAAPVSPAASRPLVLTATRSGYARDGAYANTDLSSDPSLVVKTGPAGLNRETYVTFDLSRVGTTIRSAKLRLVGRLTQPGVTGMEVRAYVVRGAWPAGPLKWANRPAATGPRLASMTVSGTNARWYEWDLTAFLIAQKAAGKRTVTIALKGVTPTTAAALFDAGRAGGNAPRLVIV